VKPLDFYLIGKHAHEAYYNSQAYSSLSRFIAAEDAVKLFLPNTEESMTQMVMPLPKSKRDWIAGWKDAEATKKLTEETSNE
jgi:hypothetical protein